MLSCSFMFMLLLNVHLSFQSQLAVKEEIEELKSIVVDPDENEAGQGYGKSSLNSFRENHL